MYVLVSFRRLGGSAALLFALAACGDGPAGAGADGGPGRGDGAAAGGYPYDEAADFDHADCESSAPLDSIEVAGIWHVDLVFEGYGAFPGPIRIDAGEEGGALGALLFGREADEVSLTATDLFIRREGETGGGERRIRAFDACAVTEDDALRGKYASCTGPECAFATFTARKVEPPEGPVAEGMTLVAEHAGAGLEPWPLGSGALTLNVRQRGDHAYLARGSDGLRIVDLSEPAAPVDVGHAPVEFEDDESYNDVKLQSGPEGKLYALVASNVRGAVVLDVSDPSAPEEVTAFPRDDPQLMGQAINVHTLFVEEGRAYLANVSAGGLDIFDVSDPASPSRLGGYVHPDVGSLGGFVHDLYVEGGRAYLNYWNHGMVVVDTAEDPGEPRLVGAFDDYPRRTSHSSWATTAGGRRIAVHGDEDYGAHVRIVDVDPASPAFMTEIGAYQTRPQVSVHNVMAVGDLALITYYQDGLRVLDLAEPAEPREIAHYQSWPGPLPGYGASFYEGAIGVDYNPAKGHVYLADTHRGLLILTLDR